MIRVDADFRVAAGHRSLEGHFPGNPIVPGVLLLDHVMSLLHCQTGRLITHLHQVKFTAALRPEEPARVQCELQDDRAVFRVFVRRDGLDVMVAAGSMALQTHRGAGA
jgi:3-hydroxyacyl-[acyl-carrier-protein] dehydratase